MKSAGLQLGQYIMLVFKQQPFVVEPNEATRRMDTRLMTQAGRYRGPAPVEGCWLFEQDLATPGKGILWCVADNEVLMVGTETDVIDLVASQ